MAWLGGDLLERDKRRQGDVAITIERVPLLGSWLH